MNKEEAIENVKKQLEGIKEANECGLATKGEFNKDIEAIETVLNLLEKKDKEIKNWEYHCTVDLEREITELNNKIFELEHNSIPVSLVEEIIEELKEEIRQLRIEKNVTYDSGIYRMRIKLEVLQELLEKRK